MAWCFAFRQEGDGFHHLLQGQLLGHFGVHILRDLGRYALLTLPLGLCNVRGVRFKCVHIGIKLRNIMGKVGLFVCILSSRQPLVPSGGSSSRWKSKNNLEQVLLYLNHLMSSGG
jgi:hypothetical protein